MLSTSHNSGLNLQTDLFYRIKMNVGVAHSEVNPNTRVMNSRGMWLTYALGVGMLHIVLLSIPFFSVPVAWTLTNVIHNLVSTLSCNKAGEVVLMYLLSVAEEWPGCMDNEFQLAKHHLCSAYPLLNELADLGRRIDTGLLWI